MSVTVRRAGCANTTLPATMTIAQRRASMSARILSGRLIQLLANSGVSLLLYNAWGHTPTRLRHRRNSSGLGLQPVLLVVTPAMATANADDGHPESNDEQYP